MSKVVKQLQNGPADKKADSSVFLRLEDLLVHYARIAPDRDAILAPDRAPVTYGALWVLVNKAVRELRTLGVGPTDRVAVVLPNGPEAAVAILAVATAAVCVPLNPNFTADEWQRYFGDFRVSALLTRAGMDSASRGVAHSLGIAVIDLSPHPKEAPCAFNLLSSGTRRPVSSELVPSADNDAFILMTSGTTSRPKMVPLTHASVCLSGYNAGAALQLDSGDRLLNVLPLYHAHGLISGLLTALAAGSSLVCTPRFDPDAFFGWLTEFRPTWYTAVPAIHRALLSAADRHKHSIRQRSLRVIRSASAPMPPDVFRELELLFGVPVIETYGMTEAASQIAANPLRRRKPGSVGRSAGVEIAIMDREDRQLAAGERGEIALRGPTITRGYDNDVAATKSAFRDGWFRTGDLGYLDRDGYLFIVGRIKEVIKRGGQQVAPAEVEEALVSHADVAEAVAFSIPHRRLGEDVAAAVVLRPGAEVSVQKLRNFVRERLARFKVPGLIRIVPEIPKGPGGKIRRSGLARALSLTMSRARVNSAGKMVPPRSRLERQLAETWADLLEFNQIGVDQDVFALGADSLTVTHLLSRLRTHFDVDLSFQDIFDAPTVAALAARVESAEKDSAAVLPSLHQTPADGRGVRLSFQQQRIHVLSGLDPTGHSYHVLEVVRLSGPLDIDALELSIAAICERHEVLRSTFLEVMGEPLQTVGTARPRLEHLDMRLCAHSKRAAAIERQARELLRQSFDIAEEPPLQAQLLRLDEDDHALVIKLHHLITDGWSQRLFWERLEALYRASSNGPAAGLPELPVQYRHFVEWQRAWLGTRAAKEQLSYWNAQLEGLKELPLRTDRPRPVTWTGRGARHPLRFSRALSRGIKSLSRAHRVTLFMTLLGAFQCLLYRYTEHDDVAVGSVIANRNQLQIERLMGMFANTIVLRTDLSGNSSFSEVLRRVRQVTLDAYRNQDLPFEEILRDRHVSRSIDRNTLFQVMFILQNPSPKAPALPGLSTHFMDLDPGIARVDLMLEAPIDADESLHGWFEYSTDLFEAATIARMAAHLQTLLEAIVANPEERICRLPLLPEGELRRILFDWNDTQTTSSRRGIFFARFARQVERTPEATAVSAGRVRLSYRELARRGSVIADRLAREGVGRDVIVILLAERGVDLLAAMIAVQRAGGAFLPLDPKIPVARLTKIIQHSGTPLVLAGQGCAAVLEKALSGMPARRRPQILILAELTQAKPRDPAPPVLPASSSLAYVIYTSGSTGIPKGAMVEQRGFANHLLSKISDLGLSASDVIAQTAPQSFDISVWQFLTALMVGGRVHIVADDEVRDPVQLAKVIQREGVTVLQIVPALLCAILDLASHESIVGALSRLRCLICIGEVLTCDLCRNWLRHFPGVALINAYGPAECSDTVATYRLTPPPPSLATVPIGRAIANTRLYVLDHYMQPVPIGVAGELCVGGVGVGRGYLNDPDQTRRSFLQDPFSHRRGARLYRTGDLARWRADGNLEFLGRVDHQVKIRGYRIELEEIERILEEHPEVRAAVVLARNDLGGEAQLLAHIVAVACCEPEVTELRDFLKTRLPEYMIPAGFIFLDRMPLTAHGKVDRPALAATRRKLKVAASEFVAPRDHTEEVLAGIWANLLKVAHIGVFANFFDLGGHSLLAGRVLARVAGAFGVSLPLRTLFEAPTVAALAQRINEAHETHSRETAIEIAHVATDGPQPVSLAQEHMLRSEREFPGLPQFNLPFAYRLQGPLNVSALEQSLAEVVRRHELLRTGFDWSAELPVALVAPANEINSFLVIDDLAHRTPARNKRAKALLLKKAELLARQETLTPFDTKRAPLFRARLLRLGADDHVLILILHHSVIDGWSIGVFMEEMSELYAAFSAGRPAQLPEPALQFSDFARWQHQWSASGAATRQLDYWSANLRKVSPVFPRNNDLGGALLASRVAHEPVHVSNDLAARLSALSHSRGTSLFMTVLTGFKALLLARSGRKDFCVATAMANRCQLKTEGIIGPLVNTTLIRTRIDADMSFHEALTRVRDSVLEAYGRQELPFDILADRLAEEDDSDPASLIQVYFVLQNAFRPLELPEVTARSFAYLEGERVLPIDRTWLSVSLKETASGIAGSCSYKTDLFEPDTLRHWMADYQTILAKAVANPETSLGRLADR